MAKLSAMGRKELLRMARERTLEGEVGDPNPVVWERMTYAAMSTGAILSKRQLRWSDGMKHDYGWKLSCNGTQAKKRGLTLEKVRANLAAKGYAEVSR